MHHGLESLLSHCVKELEESTRLRNSNPIIDSSYRRNERDILKQEERIERILNKLLDD